MTVAVTIFSLWALSNIVIIRFFQKIVSNENHEHDRAPSDRI